MSAEALDEVASGFITWCMEGGSDIGKQTRAVLRGAQIGEGAGKRLTDAPAAFAARHPQPFMC